ncbi:MAG: response regulator [Bacteroidales bacterium]|nr:response regulator [Bacteroidales bacterium]
MHQPNINNRQILVVEDEEMNWFLLRDMIELFGGIPIWAPSGAMATDIIINNPSIDLVLVDLKLPFISGAEVAQSIKKIRPLLPVVAQTAFAEPEILSEAIAAGCDSYLLKPIGMNEFLIMLSEYF